MTQSSAGSSLPPASLRLLVSPIKLMSAFVWKAVQQNRVMHYEKLLDFIGLATEIVPELLTPRQKMQLCVGLRAKLVLELCRTDGDAKRNVIQGHLDTIHSCCVELSTSEQMESSGIPLTSYSNFVNMVQNILNVPLEKEIFFQHVFTESYVSAYNLRIHQLVSEFLSRLEQLLPVPDLQQTAVWLQESSASEEFAQHLSNPYALKALLEQHKESAAISSACSTYEEDDILSTLALFSLGGHFRGSPDDDDDDDDDDGEYDSAEVSLVLEDLEDGTSQSLEDASEGWELKSKSGPCSQLIVCASGSDSQFIQRLKKKYVLKRSTAQQKTSKLQGQREKKREKSSYKEGNVVEKEKSKSKRRQKPKETAGEDKRFLSTRAIPRNFSEEETKCPTCEKVFEHPNQLKTHLKLHSFRYSCVQCEKGFTSSSGYYMHQRVHKRGRVFTCKECNKGFLCTNSLKQHQRLHEGPANFCSICEKPLSKTGFMRHMQMHRGEKNYLCTTCGKTFLSSGELLLHNRSHTGETPYTCSHCGKGFSSKSHLNVHVRSHTGERPYLCAECPKRFLTLNCLKRHGLSHDGRKPFRCADCGREFSQQCNLKRHESIHKADS